MKISSRLHGEEGASTVAVTAMVLASLILIIGILALSAASTAAMKAGTAADIAALGAADTARGLRSGDPCTIAATLASANDAVVDSCTVESDGKTVRVSVHVDVHLGPLSQSIYQASARARAGAPALTD